MKDRIRWRQYRQSDVYLKDLDAVVELHFQQEQAIGREMQLPDMMKPPVLETWVGERDGEIVSFFYIEAIAEPVFGGRDAEASASARRFAPHIFASLKQRGLRMVRMEIPCDIPEEAESIGRELDRTGFISSDGRYLHYKLDLTEC